MPDVPHIVIAVGSIVAAFVGLVLWTLYRKRRA